MTRPWARPGAITVSVLASVALTFAGCGLFDKDDAPSDGAGETLAERSSGGFAELREDGVVRRVEGRWELPSGADRGEAAHAFFNAQRAALGVHEDITTRAPEAKTSGPLETIRLPLSAHGHPILGGEALLHLALGAPEVLALTLRAPTGFGPATAAVDATAAQAAVTAAGLQPEGTPQLSWLALDMLQGRADAARLVWRVDAVGEADPDARVFYVDASTANVLWSEPRLVVKRERNVWDAKGSSLEKYIVQDPSDHLAYTEEGLYPTRSQAHPEADLGFGFAADACDYYLQTFGEERTCQPLDVFVNFGPADEAYESGGNVYFGQDRLSRDDGWETFAHEFGHTLTTATAEFASSYEPGAVDEAFGDLTAMLILRRPLGQWLVHRYTGEVMRNLENPTATGMPDHYDKLRKLAAGELAGDFNDEGEVHANSVILSHGMWRAVVRGVTVGGKEYAGVGHAKAEQMMYLAVNSFAGVKTTLKQFAHGIGLSCRVFAALPLAYVVPPADSHGITPEDCGVVVNAFAEVGLLEPDRDMDGWSDTPDNCKDISNALQLDADEDGTGDACQAPAPIPDATSGPDAEPDGQPAPGTYPDEPPDLPACIQSFRTPDSETFGPGEGWTLDSKTVAEKLYCDAKGCEGYALDCVLLRDSTGGWPVTYRLEWQPWDPALYQAADDLAEHCGEGERHWYNQQGYRGTLGSNTHLAQVVWDGTPGQDDFQFQVANQALDLLESVAWPCPGAR